MMTRYILKMITRNVRQVALEDIGKDLGVWESIIPSEQYDYDVIGRMSFRDETDEEIYKHMIYGTHGQSIHVQIGISKEELTERTEVLKENMLAVCDELYGTN